MCITEDHLTERIKVAVGSAYRSESTPLQTAGIGVVLAFAAKVGVFTALGIVVEPVWIDYLATGIVFSGGATVFNELVKLISGLAAGYSLERILTAFLYMFIPILLSINPHNTPTDNWIS